MAVAAGYVTPRWDQQEAVQSSPTSLSAAPSIAIYGIEGLCDIHKQTACQLNSRPKTR